MSAPEPGRRAADPTPAPDTGAAPAGPDPERAELDARVLAWMREEPWRPDEARFERLALDLFAFQAERCPAFARFCERRGRTPSSVRSWREIPPVPAGAFKELALRSFPPERECHAFRTSGTSTAERGVLHLDTLELYEASLRPAFQLHVLPDLGELGGSILTRVLAPPRAEAPDSSLSHMLERVLHAYGAPGSGCDVRDGSLRAGALIDALRGAAGSGSDTAGGPLRTQALRAAAGRGEPVLLCGTAFAFVHLLEELARRGERLALPPGSRAMETGGFKGRARERTREELYAEIRERLGLPPERVVNQYGMTELGSQLYDSVLRFPDQPRRKLAPPWMRVRVVDPRTGEEARPGDTGVVCVVDLANTGSVLAVQTADLGRRVEVPGAEAGFEIIGREPGAEARGCSIAADEMLQRAGT